MSEVKYTLSKNTVYPSQAGDGWKARALYYEPNGDYDEEGAPIMRRKEKSRTFKSAEDGRKLGKREAVRLATEWVEQLNEEAASSSHRINPAETVGEYVDAFVSSKEHDCEKSTINGYRIRASRIKDGLGDVPLVSLTPDMVTTWMDRLADEKGLSHRTINDARALLNSAMQDAFINQRIPSNPVARTKPFKREHRRISSLDAHERARLVEDLQNPNPNPKESSAMRVGVELALFMGMREGEICGLRWRNVDIHSRFVTVCEAVGRDGNGAYLKAPKSEKSERRIPIPEFVYGELMKRRAEMQEKAINAGLSFSPEWFVIGDVDGEFVNPRLLYRAWCRRRERLGLVATDGEPPSLHDLRHTFATTAIANGTDMKSLQYLMGHEDIQTTMDFYADYEDEAVSRAMANVERAMLAPAPMADVYEFSATGTDC